MNIFEPVKKTFKAVGSVGGLAADFVEGTIDVGSKAKNALNGEIDSLQYERDLQNATSRILAKAKYIREIMDQLHISADEAEELLRKEMNI